MYYRIGKVGMRTQTRWSTEYLSQQRHAREAGGVHTCTCKKTNAVPKTSRNQVTDALGHTSRGGSENTGTPQSRPNKIYSRQSRTRRHKTSLMLSTITQKVNQHDTCFVPFAAFKVALPPPSIDNRVKIGGLKNVDVGPTAK